MVDKIGLRLASIITSNAKSCELFEAPVLSKKIMEPWSPRLFYPSDFYRFVVD